MMQLDYKEEYFNVVEAEPPPPPPPVHPPIEVVGMDYNQNGVIDVDDLAMLMGAYGLVKGSPGYERRFDNNFDGVVNDADKSIVERQVGLRIADIRAAVRTGEVEWITWPADPPYSTVPFTGPLVALDRDAIAMFRGGLYRKTDKRYDGWTTVTLHPPESGYTCVSFGFEMTVAAYKGLGWGHILYAGSDFPHGYNIFWTGGDWHDLSNWVVLEPQNYEMWKASEIFWAMHATKRIYLPIYGSPGHIYCVSLDVDYSAATVSLGGFGGGVISNNAEEPVPTIFYTEIP